MHLPTTGVLPPDLPRKLWCPGNPAPQALLLEAIGGETETDWGKGEEHREILLSSRNRKVINQDLTPICLTPTYSRFLSQLVIFFRLRSRGFCQHRQELVLAAALGSLGQIVCRR